MPRGIFSGSLEAGSRPRLPAAVAPLRRLPLHTQILLGLAVGAVAGVAANLLWRDAPALLWIVGNVAELVVQVCLRLLFMLVVPLVFTSLALGVAALGDVSQVGRVAGTEIGFLLVTTALDAGRLQRGCRLLGGSEDGAARRK